MYSDIQFFSREPTRDHASTCSRLSEGHHRSRTNVQLDVVVGEVR